MLSKFTRSLFLKSSAIAMIVAGVVGFLYYQVSERRELDELREELMALSQTAANFIVADRHDAIVHRPEERKAAWDEVATILERIKEANPKILYIYTLAPTATTETDGSLMFVVDLEEQVNEDVAAASVGEIYEAAELAPRMLDGLKAPAADDEITTDKWGSVLSGYAPILRADGSSAGVVGIDVSADSIASLQQDILVNTLLITLLYCSISLLLFRFLSARIEEPIVALKASMNEIQKGNYSKRLTLNRDDEFEELAQVHNLALDALREREDLQKLLSDTNHSLSEALAAKKDFIALISHELRTPLNPILGATDLLRETLKDSEDLELVQMIRKGAHSLQESIEDILLVSSLEEESLQIASESIRLDVLAEDLSDLYAPIIKERLLAFECKLPPDLKLIDFHSSYLVLRTLLKQILANAIKFTAKGSVHLAVETFTEDGRRQVRFIVRDTGCGIPKEQFRKVFDVFMQEDISSTRKYGGLGLGLTIASLCATKLKGRIELESEVGKGSEFRVIVPDLRGA